MEINTENMETLMLTSSYEQPSLKKYGAMKECTVGTGGSGGDFLAYSDRSKDSD